ncbi:hypothetical protein HWI79_877 [Cryptosporidium felis]|nr:hypothetical protein HWI79_877 [Cryptosporidium felis]
MKKEPNRFLWLALIAVLAVLLGSCLLPAAGEDPGASDIVKLVERDKPTEDSGKQPEFPPEEVVELEGAAAGEGTSEVQSPEQILEVCASLDESFSKDCSVESIEKDLQDLAAACKDGLGNLGTIKKAASKIVESFGESDLSELSECSTMVYTSALFISSNEEGDQAEESASLEDESLEVDDSNMESEQD